MSPAPEQEARVKIDAMLDQAGWEVQNFNNANIFCKKTETTKGQAYTFYKELIFVKCAGATPVHSKTDIPFFLFGGIE